MLRKSLSKMRILRSSCPVPSPISSPQKNARGGCRALTLPVPMSVWSVNRARNVLALRLIIATRALSQRRLFCKTSSRSGPMQALCLSAPRMLPRSGLVISVEA